MKKSNHQKTADKNNTESTNFNNHKNYILIVGDNMIKNMNGFKLTGNIIKVRQFSGAKTSCMKDYI